MPQDSHLLTILGIENVSRKEVRSLSCRVSTYAILCKFRLIGKLIYLDVERLSSKNKKVVKAIMKRLNKEV